MVVDGAFILLMMAPFGYTNFTDIQQIGVPESDDWSLLLDTDDLMFTSLFQASAVTGPRNPRFSNSAEGIWKKFCADGVMSPHKVHTHTL
jgi:hypothetical protein